MNDSANSSCLYHKLPFVISGETVYFLKISLLNSVKFYSQKDKKTVSVSTKNEFLKTTYL